MYEGAAALQLVCSHIYVSFYNCSLEFGSSMDSRMRCGEASQPLELCGSAICQLVLSQAVLHGSVVPPPAWYSDDAISTEADVSLV